MIFKRILSNLIDFSVFAVAYFFIYEIHGFEVRPDYSVLVFFYAYVFGISLPVFAFRNTIGKKILSLDWKDEDNLRLKLILKYTFYFLLFVPSFSLMSAVIEFPFWNKNFLKMDRSLPSLTFLIFIFSDLIVFFLSLGKFHIVDYILKLELVSFGYRRTVVKNLSYIYLFTSCFLILNFLQHKYQFSFSHLEKSVGSEYRKEQFPKAKEMGINTLTIRKNSSNVLVPSEPATFLFKKELKQKTVYAILPKDYFNSSFFRKKIGYELLTQSDRNNIFSGYSPSQTRLVLANIEKSFFGGVTTYYYIYYYDNINPLWSMYGGVKSDSTKIQEYVDLTNAFFREIYVNPKEKVSVKSIMDSEKISFGFDDSIYLKLNKIPFEKSKMHGQIRYLIPTARNDFSLHFTNFLQDEAEGIDDNVNDLIQARNILTDKEL